MTPAIKVAEKHKIAFQVHQYKHDKKHESYGLEAAEKMNVDPKRVFKTLVVDLDKQLVVAILPVTEQLNLKAVANALKGKKAQMADKNDVLRSSGYVLGGVSPLGQKKQLTTVIDDTAKLYPDIYVSAGKRGLEIQLNAEDLASILSASFVALI
ncbi:Cys-tRNA(Pro) deacylase [Psychromonas sp. 14N.309.X.WAT.B.A12]|uniref:Cys-tRNA(Pro) deacylase n=1 Tax=Psychromonas sp. 14N.309.X.WAT.B.A12 TaxID=2998322 RepID=UPI0025AFFA04|nr:Cys-tRNA(Pro) deacylase [Psychromonas sp. 14N.309.X.WAT.B.A12]MDN2662360.1 Cys-tRNA(Pro) deacylase [Psychromonas sp. 14N.309.X.WAT.B.A12]